MKNFLKQLLVIIVAGVYTVSPVDGIPDIVPVAGQTDDTVVIIAALIYIIYLVKKNKENKEKIINNSNKSENE